MKSNSTVLINIVLYRPDKKNLLALLCSCLQYPAAKILLFDNSELPNHLNLINTDKVILFQSPKNVGVAGAHYYACQLAETENFNFVLFLDQDSQLPDHFIDNMVFGFYRLQTIYSRLCAIGPAWRDPRLFAWQQENDKNKLKNKLNPILGMHKLKKKLIGKLRMEENLLISSGMLIWIPTLKEIGYPKKEYFIDLVDTEWCLRARSKKYQVILFEEIQMQHTLGEVKRIKNFILQYQNPVRYYYSIRNSLYLFGEKTIPWSFRIFILLRNIYQIRKIPFVPEPKASFIAALRGLKDGLCTKKHYL